MKKNIITTISTLRCKSSEATDQETKEIIKDLEDSLEGHKTGIGLSAIQIGIAKRVSIIRMGDFKLDLINPVIKEKYNKIRYKNEGCLSLPGLSITTSRYNVIVLENKGQTIPYRGILSVAIQHEVAHMNGRTILDDKWHKRK